MYNSYLKSARGNLLGCLHGKHLHLVFFSFVIVLFQTTSLILYVGTYLPGDEM